MRGLANVASFARSFMIWFLILVAGALSVAMLWVVLRLSWDLVDVSGTRTRLQSAQPASESPGLLGVTSSPIAGASAAGSAPVTASVAENARVDAPVAGSKGDEAKDLISNSTAAISAAIATVTLVITLGTTWFAEKLRTIEILRREMTDERAASQAVARDLRDLADVIKAEAQHEQQLRRANLAAKLELQRWVVQNAGRETAPGRHAELCAHLDMLMSTDVDARYSAFGFLKTFLPEPQMAMELVAISNYCDLCDSTHGGNVNRHGVWCKLFDPIERTAYAEKARLRSIGEWL